LNPIIAILVPDTPKPPSDPSSDPYGKTKSVSMAKDVSSTGSGPSFAPAPADPYAKQPSQPTSPAAGTATISDMNGCVQMGLGRERMDVPIKLSYSASIAAIMTPTELTLAPCDRFDWKWVWPNSCTPLQIPIPEAFMSMDSEVGIQADASISPMLDLSDGVTPDTTITSSDITQDTLATRIVHLQVKCDLTGEKLSYTLQPKVLCPDGASYSPPAQKITISTQPTVLVKQSLGGPGSMVQIALGQTLTDTVTVVNHSKQEIKGAKLTISISNMAVGVQVDDASCENLGNNISCTFDMGVGASKIVKMTFTLPKSVKETEPYSITATLKLANQSSTIDADKIGFTLQPAN
jgi:hypothetical protein